MRMPVKPRWGIVTSATIAIAMICASLIGVVVRLPATTRAELVIKLFLVFVMTAGGLRVVHGIIADALTRVSEKGVRRLRLLSMKDHQWREIESVRRRGHLLDVACAHGTFRMNLRLLRNPGDLLSFLKQRIPASAFREDR